MTLGPDRRTTAQRLLDTYHATGHLPRISGGDHEGKGDGNEGGDGGGNEGEAGQNQNESQNQNAKPGGEQGAGSAESNGFKAITSQADLDNIIGRRLGRERDSLKKSIRDEIDEEIRAEEAKKQGDFEKLYTDLKAKFDEQSEDLANRDRDALRATIARKHNLPDDAVKYLTGDDEESIEAAAKDLAKLTARSEDVDTDSGKRNASTGKKKQDDSILVNYKFGQRR